MPQNIEFEELTKNERILLLRAYDYDIDGEGYVLAPSGNRIPSQEEPEKFLRVEDAALMPGSLKLIDGTPTSISRFIREELEG